jgi:hypothetical protein
MRLLSNEVTDGDCGVIDGWVLTVHSEFEQCFGISKGLPITPAERGIGKPFRGPDSFQHLYATESECHGGQWEQLDK